MTSSDQLTFFAVASPASPSPSRGSSKASATLVISGLSSFDWCWCFGRAGWWWRTLAGLSGWRSTRVGLTWKARTTPAGRRYFQLAVSTRPTDATASGLWPSPDASTNRKSSTALHGSGPRIGRGESALHVSAPGLEQAVELAAGVLPKEYDSLDQLSPAAARLWPTPQYHDHHPGDASRIGRHGTKHGDRNLNDWVAMLPTPRHEGFDAGAHRGKPDSLHAYAKMLPTPVTTDHKQHSSPAALARRSPQLGPTVGSTPAMKLNPDWVSRMMGLPDGWLDI